MFHECKNSGFYLYGLIDFQTITNASINRGVCYLCGMNKERSGIKYGVLLIS
ncbi:hypothetical protein VST7929_01483 [Vibrio stylophorae]|uniref:Transposase n=1 Tax=Vibrio stylophorae TaxID=659351 RepID=A0ABN8DTF2_9VIBR|nr:hypothetical protein VST7929_01483 [Vibrio stylophorae]